MPLTIVPYSAEWESAAQRFNQRLRAGHAPTGFFLPEGAPGAPHYIAIDETGEARGGVIIQPFAARIHGERATVVNVQSPLSEGIVNPRYTLVVSQLIRYAMKVSPYAFVVGMGGMDRPLPRVLKAVGWRVVEVPFYFRLLRAARCFREIRPLRRGGWRTAALDIASWIGVAPIAAAVLHRSRVGPGLAVERARPWGDWTDCVWSTVHPGLAFAVDRDSEGARTLYGGGLPGLHLFEAPGGAEAGWFSLVVTKMNDSPYFGGLTVATLADAVAPAAVLGRLVDAAVGEARRMGADLLVANFLHCDGQSACRSAGLRPGPSNYLWAASPKLAEAAPPAQSYISRRDGDGLINLAR